MTLNAKRRRTHDKLAALPGVRPVRRPVTPGSAEEFDLYYVRAGRKSAHPLVIIPGGPGAASVQVYRGLRRRVAARGLDVIMIEHRGVGLSRHDDSGADLPPEAITVEQVVDDVAAVLDDAGVGKAIIYGTSYGTYIAAGVGVRYPERVHAMVLDSPLLSAADIDEVRSTMRGLLLDGADEETYHLAPKVRQLVDDGVLNGTASEIASMLYGYGGPSLLERQLNLLLRQRTLLWSGLSQVSRMSMRTAPYRNEADLVSRIAFRELDYVGVPDGQPLDPSEAMAEIADVIEPFEAEPFDLIVDMPKFTWPTVVISGGRDLTTPPAVAERVASLIPDAVLVNLPTTGHSALDTREPAALAVIQAVWSGEPAALEGLGPSLDSLPGRRALRVGLSAIAAAAVVEGVLPGAVSRLARKLRAVATA